MVAVLLSALSLRADSLQMVVLERTNLHVFPIITGCVVARHGVGRRSDVAVVHRVSKRALVCCHKSLTAQLDKGSLPTRKP